jgi:Phage derived protein Gp49-like (DUF891)
MKGRDGIARAVFVTAIGERVVVVHAFEKKGQRTPLRALDGPHGEDDASPLCRAPRWAMALASLDAGEDSANPALTPPRHGRR